MRKYGSIEFTFLLCKTETETPFIAPFIDIGATRRFWLVNPWEIWPVIDFPASDIFSILLKTKCHHFENVFITSGTVSCQNNLKTSKTWISYGHSVKASFQLQGEHHSCRCAYQWLILLLLGALSLSGLLNKTPGYPNNSDCITNNLTPFFKYSTSSVIVKAMLCILFHTE